MAGFHTSVRLINYPFDDFQFTVNLAAGITLADEGKALTQDTSADTTMKLAGDGDPIDAILIKVENRVIEGHLVGTVGFKFAEKLTIKSGLTGAAVPARGSRLCGAGAGEVKAIDPAFATDALAALYAHAPRCWQVAGALADATKF